MSSPVSRVPGGRPAWHVRIAHFPWKTALATLRDRFREERLGVTASSLTFTTVLALVPLLTVMLAAFTAFPIFGKLQEVLQRWLFESLVPESISKQVLGYLTQFASKASRLGAVGIGFFVVTALALILTIDRTLNGIWRVPRLRPLGQRLLMYWAALTVGPMVLAASLALTGTVTAASAGWLGSVLPHGLALLFDSLGLVVLAGGMAVLYRFVPNTPVRWRHAWVGGGLVALCLEGAKFLLTLYLVQVPTYSLIYGTFATVPILLIWIYVAWGVVLFGAVFTASLPTLVALGNGGARRELGAGAPFQLAVEALQALAAAQSTPGLGLPTAVLAQRLAVPEARLAPVLDTLAALEWTGQVGVAAAPAAEPRWVLLADPVTTPLAPLVQRLLLNQADSLAPFWQGAGLQRLKLADVLLNQ